MSCQKRQAFFKPRLDILDRGLLTISDGVIFGTGVGMSQHVITPRRVRSILMVKRIVIGAGAFIGAESRLAPGARIAPAAVVPYRSYIRIGKKFEVSSAM